MNELLTEDSLAAADDENNVGSEINNRYLNKSLESKL